MLNKILYSEKDGSIACNVLRIREGYEAEPLALGSFLLYAVIGCPSFGIIKLFLEKVCKFKNIV
jgi:hypothetical protein